MTPGIAKLLVLAIVFVMAFSLAMALGTGAIGPQDGATLSPVANAADPPTPASRSDVVSGEITYPSTLGGKNVTGDHGELNGDILNFPSTTATKESWTYTETFKNVALSTDNSQVYKSNTSGKVGADIYTGVNGTWGFGANDGAAQATVMLATNYELGSLLKALIHSPHYKVTAKLTADVSTIGAGTKSIWGDKDGYSYAGLKSQTSRLTAKSAYDNKGTAQFTAGKGNYDPSGTFSVGETALTADNLGIFFGWTYSFQNGGRQIYIAVTNIKLTFTITYQSGQAENTKTMDDGSAPVMLSQLKLTNGVSIAATETYYPFRSSTQVGSGKEAWPVHYANIADQLANALDSKNDGTKATLNSYTSSPYGQITVDSKAVDYYKRSAISYADTYNYNYSGQFEIDAATDANYRKYAGIGGFNSTDGKSWTVNSNSARIYGVSGIKQVRVAATVGSATTNSSYVTVYDLSNNSTSGYTEIKNGTTVIGYFTVTRTNRVRVTVNIYMITNATVVTEVVDMGNNTCKSTTEFKGIDIKGPTSDDVTNSFNAAGNPNLAINLDTGSRNLADANWHRQENISMTANVTIPSSVASASNFSPYLWFFAVQRENSLAELKAKAAPTYANYNAIKSKGMLPVAFNSSSGQNVFEYNFKDGYMLGIPGENGTRDKITYKQTDSDVVTGAGYYRFVFYTVDLAGNTGISFTCYVKVDYDVPAYEFDISYIDDVTSNKVSIDQNGNWATGETTVSINHRLNLSGNTFIFYDNPSVGNSSKYVFSVNEYGIVSFNGSNVSYENGKLYLVKSDGSKEECVNGKIALAIGTSAEPNTIVYISYDITEFAANGNPVTYDGNGKPTTPVAYRYGLVKITFEGATEGIYPNIDWTTRFTAYAGVFDTVASAEANTEVKNYEIGDNDEKWRGGVKIRIDRNAPMTPTVEDRNGYYYYDEFNPSDNVGVFENGVYTIDVKNRKWKTDNYTLATYLTFNDPLIGSYRSQLSVYYGVKYIATKSDMEALKALNIETAYRTITQENSSQYFNTLIKTSASSLNESCYSQFNFDLLSVLNGGMRVIYVWSEDQAGYRSELLTFFILADTANYTVNAGVLENEEHGRTGTAFSTDKTAYKRGETVKLTLKLADNFAPFALTKTQGEDIVKLLENYTQNNAWAATNDGKMYIDADILTFTFSGEGAQDCAMTFLMENADNIGEMANISFVFSQRKRIGYSLSSLNVPYSAKPAVVAVATTNAGDTAALSHFAFRFVNADNNLLYALSGGRYTDDPNIALKDENDNPVLFVPVIPGEYRVRVYIPREDESFVTNDYTHDGDVQTFVHCVNQFIIRRGSVTITAKSNPTRYGEAIVLEYDVEGFDEDAATEAEYLRGSLTLNIPGGWNPRNMLNVGTYQIVQDEPFYISDNFDIKFVEGTHTVTQRTVNIVTWAWSKVYGENDPEFRFGVETSQFDWYVEQGGALADIMGKVFKNYTLDKMETLGDQTYQLFLAGGSIGRESGENVRSEYAYIANRNSFEVDGNFTVSVSNTQHFSITVRTVVLDVSINSTVVPSGAIPNVNDLVPDYLIASKDMSLKAEIDALIAGQLYLDENPTTPTTTKPDEYSDWIWHAILLKDGAGNNNIKFELGNDSYYIIYIAADSAVLINVKSDAVFSAMFGIRWTHDVLAFEKWADNFVVSGIEPGDWDEIKWTATVSGASYDTYLSVGSHRVNLTDVELYKDGQKLEKFVLADNFNIIVTAAPVVVRPVAAATQKVYGDPEANLNISFEIVSVGGQPMTQQSTYADYTYDRIMSVINNAYARGRYTKDGEFRYIDNSAFSDATDADGVIFGTTDYYGFAINPNLKFESADNSFSVVPQEKSDVRFIISRKTIDLDVSNFIGVNKSFDGTADVVNHTKAYDISSLLVRAQDKVSLSYDQPRYVKIDSTESEIGSTQKATFAGIEFSNLSLTGDSAKNYVLGVIYNSTLDGKLYVGNEEVSGDTAITSEVSVIIYYIDNNTETDKITIFMSTIGVHKNDFIVSKQYDNSREITIFAIEVKNNSDSHGIGSTALYNVWRSGKAELTQKVFLSGAEVGSNYVVNISLFFPIEGASGLKIKDDDDYLEPDITIQKHVTADGREGVLVIIGNMPASITQRKLDASSFVSVTPQNRDYNSLGDVETTYEFAQGALAEGDTVSSVGLTLMAYINDSNFNYGTHQIRFAAMGENDTDTTLEDSNYTIDIDALNNYFVGDRELTVEISRAKLMPNVSFVDKDYNGTADVETKKGLGDTAFTTLRYSTVLASELACFSFGGTVEYKLSAVNPKTGKVEENGNVMTDADGNVVKHNVLIKGLSIVEEGNNGYLKNYEIYGYEYSDGKYNSIGGAAEGREYEYEMLDVVTVFKKTVRVLVNNIDVKEKLYNGDTDAEVYIGLNGSGVAEGHDKHLHIEATGTFARSIVSDNVPIVISDVKLVASDEEGVLLLNNYILQEYTERRTANILARPVAVSVNLGEKVYNGSAQISSREISFGIDGLLENEASGYAVQVTGGAYYFDKNVAYEIEEKVDEDGNKSEVVTILNKAGVVYAPMLRNVKGKVNYRPVLSSKELIGEDYIAYVDAADKLHYNEKAPDGAANVIYYYELPTADKYIVINDEEANKKMISDAGSAIAGYYMYEGVAVYAVDSQYQGDVSGNMPAITYIKGEGKILQKSISISASGIQPIEGSTAFSKMYDGTKNFSGKEGVDYRYTDGSIMGKIPGDDIEIDGTTGEFDDAYTTANYVIFRAKGLKGKDLRNYCIDGTVGTARFRASIVKRPITASLEDGTLTYGDNINDVVGKITYKAHGNAEGELYDLTLWEGALFLSFDKYVSMTGVPMGAYQAPLRSRMYTKTTDNNFVKFPEDAVFDENDTSKYFIKLTGINALPTAKATFITSKPSVGTTASAYVIDEGSAVSFAFQPQYTNGDTSVLEVVPKDLFIASDGVDYLKLYGAGDPSVTRYYLDVNGKNGIASGETDVTLFTEGGVNYYPVVKWGILNTESGKFRKLYDESDPAANYADAYKYAVLSSKLGKNETYVAYFEAPEGVDYDDLATLSNYKVHLGDAFNVENGKIVTVYNGFNSLKTNTATLHIDLPSIEGLKLRDTVDNTYNLTYNGTSQTTSIIEGDVRSSDEIAVVAQNGQTVEIVNADTYVGVIRVRRYIKIDKGDTNGYFIEWTNDANVTIVIAKASPRLSVRNSSKIYDGKAYKYTVSGAGNLIDFADGVVIRSGDADIIHEKLQGDEYVPTANNEMCDAGTYRVTIALNDRFAERNGNYNKETVVATYTIMRAKVNVEISKDGYQKKTVSGGVVTLSDMYDSERNYQVTYSVSMDSSLPSEIVLPKSQTEIAFEKEISSSGRYSFNVMVKDGELNKDNYVITGGRGVLELYTKFVEADNADITMTDAVVANRFEVRLVDGELGGGSDMDLWSKIDLYMPHIDNNASISAVVEVSLYYGKSLVNLNGNTVNVSIDIPQQVGTLDGKAIYFVNKEGGLTKLEGYEVADGKLKYTTDHLGTLVFVDLTPASLPTWAVILIACLAAAVAITVLWTVIAYVIRKSKLKKLI